MRTTIDTFELWCSRHSYDYFNAKLTEKVKRFGAQRMADEKALLDARSKYWFEECVEEVKKVDNEETAKRMHIYSKKVHPEVMYMMAPKVVHYSTLPLRSYLQSYCKNSSNTEYKFQCFSHIFIFCIYIYIIYNVQFEWSGGAWRFR